MLNLRLKRRHKIFKLAEITISGQIGRAHILNLSLNGALVHFSLPLRRSSLIVLQCGDQSRTAHVVWTSGRHAGVKFVSPLLTEELLEFLNA
jgi:hypothetical protein